MRTSRNLFGASRFAPSVWPFGRLAVALVAGGLMMASPAHASWEVSYRPDGIDTPDSLGEESAEWSRGIDVYPGYDPQTGFVRIDDITTTPFHYRPSSVDYATQESGSNSSWSATSAYSGGSITFRFKWIPNADGSDATPPPLIVLDIWGSAMGEAISPTSQSTAESQFGKLQATGSPEAFTLPYGDMHGYSRNANATVPAGSPLKIPLVVPPGATQVDYTFSLHGAGTTSELEITRDTGSLSPNSSAG